MPGKFLLLQPTTTFKLAWDWLIIAFVLYSALAVPLEISFGATLFATDAFVDAFFWLDLLLTLNTSYYDYWGDVVSSRWCVEALP